jgi:hypothetical protein
VLFSQRRGSGNAEFDIADCLFPEAILQLLQKLALPISLEFIAKAWLQDLNAKDATAQASRGGMLGNEVADHFLPSRADFAFVQALAQAEFRHEFLKHIAHNSAAILALEGFLQAPPLGEDTGSENTPDMKKAPGSRPGAGFLKGLLRVVSDRLDRAAIHRLFAKSLLLGSLRLFINIAVAAIVVALEIRRSGLAAQIAVDALVIHEKLTLYVVAVFVCYVCHIGLKN